ncbi:hypothetical protein ANCCAN_14835 [Ancylostoma caninum]|uniref:Uncharacterized protein n=1 Tax=Ancylostoma caninum TaxID=29170 RepID=A0A368G6F0_ANCCA|nr:hypothetical protein ANCCAN_14835 [Ancylostoma caninum]
MLLILVSLPLLAFCLEDTNLNYVHDGDATIRSATQSISKVAKGPLPAYLYKPIPNHKFKYSNYKHYMMPTSTHNPETSFEFVVEAPLNVEEPLPPPPPPPQPFIPTPYYLPYFNDMPLYNGYRMLMNTHKQTPSFLDYLSSNKESNMPRYADYIGAEKLLGQLATQKVAKKNTDV